MAFHTVMESIFLAPYKIDNTMEKQINKGAIQRIIIGNEFVFAISINAPYCLFS